MTNSGEVDASTQTVLYYFWLPLGKDAFGFKNVEKSPLNVQAPRLAPAEQPVSRRILQVISDLQGRGAALGGVRFTDVREPMDAPALGLRLLTLPFEFMPAATWDQYFYAQPQSGTLTIWSNGLYLWHLNLPTGLTGENLVHFLRDDFFSNHIETLFQLHWAKRVQSSDSGNQHAELDLSDYYGALNYYQMDLLFNALFDATSEPHEFFNAESIEPRAEQTYGLRNVLKDISLYAYQTGTRHPIHRPLFTERKDYSYRRQDKSDPIRIDIRDADDLDKFEALVSRLTYASMEHFIRVSITFGIAPYQGGLEYARSELLRLLLSTRINLNPSQLVAPSLRSGHATVTELEAYYDLVSGKLPKLTFLGALMEDMRDVTVPFSARLDSGADSDNTYWSEWRASRKSVDEALSQFERQVVALSAGLDAVASNVNSARSEAMIAELTESRKISEIGAEQPGAGTQRLQRVMLAQSESSRIGLKVTIAGIFVGGLFGLSQAYATFAATAWASVDDRSWVWFGKWWWFGVLAFVGTAILGVAALIIWWIARKWIFTVAANSSHVGTDLEPGLDGGSVLSDTYEYPGSSDVYDYAAVDEEISGFEHMDTLAAKWRSAMFPVVLSDPAAPSLRYSFFEEVPVAGVVRRKYSFYSLPNAGGVDYVVHFELDRQGTPSKTVLRDVRFVFRHSARDAQSPPVSPDHLILNYVGDLLPNKTGAERRHFSLSKFNVPLP